MSAYFIAEMDIIHGAGIERYRREAGYLLEKYGARALAIDEAPVAISGEWRPKSLVLIEFPDLAAIESLFASEEYKPLRLIRDASSRTNSVAIRGFSSNPSAAVA